MRTLPLPPGNKSATLRTGQRYRTPLAGVMDAAWITAYSEIIHLDVTAYSHKRPMPALDGSVRNFSAACSSHLVRSACGIEFLATARIQSGA